MKRLHKFLALVFVCTGFLFYSCETTNLNLTQNPNALTPEQADVNFYLNAIQVDFGDLVERFGTTGSELTRIDYMYGRDYPNAYSPATFDGRWSLAYHSIINNIRAMQPLATSANMSNHLGMAQVIEAYTMVTLVDFFGDVPYSEANDPTNLNPKADGGATIYAAALALLDQATVNFAKNSLTIPQNDFFYAKNFTKWTKLANTLKMKIYLQSRLVDGTAIAKFNAIVASGNYITSTSENFMFQWGKNQVSPDSRHPRYSTDYKGDGADNYQSNWLMGTMYSASDATNRDVRIRYYFYRQVSSVPGQSGAPANEQTLTCSLQTAPAHYVAGGYTFCGLPVGYWGRDHGNEEGIPPDGFLRTLTGVYPSGGRFDDSTFRGTALVTGGQGAGVTPILLASTVDFWKAELALVAGNAPVAKAAYLSGIDKSIATVTAFAAKDAGHDATREPTALQITAFKAKKASIFDAAATDVAKWNVVSEQFWISLYGNGIDAYNFYRRTGYPHTLQPNIEPNPGTFVRSLWYPANYANNNANATQKSSVAGQVFWDNNPASPAFPVSN